MTILQHYYSFQLEITSKEIYFASKNIPAACTSNGKIFLLYANEGQTLNISITDLGNTAVDSEDVYGTLKDPASKKNELVMETGDVILLQHSQVTLKYLFIAVLALCCILLVSCNAK